MRNLPSRSTKTLLHALRASSLTKHCLAAGALALLGATSPLQAQGSWSDEFDLPGLFLGEIWAVGEYQGQVVAGGDGWFTADGHDFGQVALFDGTHWQPIGPRLEGWIGLEHLEHGVT